MFVVRYDSSRTRLESHTDGGYISFNVLLNDDFEGGGTRFWNRLQHGPFALVQPPVGNVLLNSAMIRHEGMPITSGVRHILVGFLAIDPVDPLTAEPTGLSWFASWLSLPFLHVRLKESYVASHARLEKISKGESTEANWMDHRYVRSLMRDLIVWVERIGDALSPHFHVSMVMPEKAQDYLNVLDEASHEMSLSWFEGQLLKQDGGISKTVPTRQQVSHDSFTEL